MKRSLNEVERICQKAAEGAGAPAGLDTDAAKSAAWLLARGLPAVADLAADLTRFPALASACRFARDDFGDDRVVDAAGKAGAVIAPMLIDLLVARAVRKNAPARLRVDGLSAPLFLLPAAVGYGLEGWGFQLALSAGERRCIVRIAAGGAVDIRGTESDPAALFETGTEWSLEAVCATHTLDDPEESELARLSDGLEAAARQSLAEGVAPDPEFWAQLKGLATKVLVPATERSHLMGAGALGSDNE